MWGHPARQLANASGRQDEVCSRPGVRLWRGWSATRDSGMMLFMTFTRITIDPAVCTGKPCIRGMRFPVARLLGLLAAGETREQILQAYPYLEPGDIDEALRYAAFLAEDETIELAATE